MYINKLLRDTMFYYYSFGMNMTTNIKMLIIRLYYSCVKSVTNYYLIKTNKKIMMMNYARKKKKKIEIYYIYI
jgi:hypothetical protein